MMSARLFALNSGRINLIRGYATAKKAPILAGPIKKMVVADSDGKPGLFTNIFTQ